MPLNDCFRTILVILGLIGLTASTKAQQNDPAGYYITLTHDTIRGSFPHYHETANSPAFITFQQTGSPQSTRLTPDNTLTVAINNSDTYLSYHGSRLTNPTSPTQDDMLDSLANTSIFLRQIFNDGNYKLYELEDRLRVNFYVSGDTMQLHELYYKAYIQEGKSIESSRFRDQLGLLFQARLNGDPSLTRRINEVQYTEPALIKLFQSASGGHKGGAATKAAAARVFFGLGASFNFFHVSAAQPNVLVASGSYNTMVSPVFQIGLRYPLGRGAQRFFLSATAQAYTWKNSNTDSYLGPSSYKGTTINLPLGLGWNLITTPNLSLAITGGAAPTYIAKETEDGFYGYNTPGGSTIVTTPYHVDDTGNFCFSWFAGTELFIGQHVSISLNYITPYTTSNYIYYYPKHSAAQLSFRYAL